MQEQPKVLDQPISSAPVPQVYKQSIKEAANNLPPAPDYKTDLPTDAEVLGKPEAPKTLDANVDATKVADADEGQEEDSAPVIESIAQEVNEVAESAKKTIVAEEKLKEFNIDDSDDVEFLRNLYKDNVADEENETSEKTTGKTTKAADIDLEEKYRPYKEKASEYEEVLANPLAKAFIEFLKTGKSDPNEFAKEVGFIDIDSMTPEKIMEIDFRNEGLTQEEIAQELESFESMSPYEKKKRVNSVKSELIQKRDEKLKSFTAGNEKTQQIYKQAVSEGMARLNDVIPKMEGKKYEGLLITPEMANSIKQYVISSPVPILNEQGLLVGFDIKESIGVAVTKLYKNQWKKALVELGRSIGADKTLTARIRPNKKVATSAVIPVQQKSFDDIANERANKQWEKRMGKHNTNK